VLTTPLLIESLKGSSTEATLYRFWLQLPACLRSLLLRSAQRLGALGVSGVSAGQHACLSRVCPLFPGEVVDKRSPWCLSIISETFSWILSLVELFVTTMFSVSATRMFAASATRVFAGECHTRVRARATRVCCQCRASGKHTAEAACWFLSPHSAFFLYNQRASLCH